MYTISKKKMGAAVFANTLGQGGTWKLSFNTTGRVVLLTYNEKGWTRDPSIVYGSTGPSIPMRYGYSWMMVSITRFRTPRLLSSCSESPDIC